MDTASHLLLMVLFAGCVAIVGGVLLAIGLAMFASPLASTWPDGLDKTAEVLGFKEKAAEPMVPSPIPEYVMPGVRWSALGTAIAGVAGTLVVFVLAWLLARKQFPGRDALGAIEPASAPCC